MAAKVAELILAVVWDVDSGAPKEPCIRWGGVGAKIPVGPCRLLMQLSVL